MLWANVSAKGGGPELWGPFGRRPRERAMLQLKFSNFKFKNEQKRIVTCNGGHQPQHARTLTQHGLDMLDHPQEHVASPDPPFTRLRPDLPPPRLVFFLFCDGKEKRSQSQCPRRQTRASQKLGLTPSRAWKAVPIAHVHRRPVHFTSKLAASKPVRTGVGLNGEEPWARRDLYLRPLATPRPVNAKAWTGEGPEQERACGVGSARRPQSLCAEVVGRQRAVKCAVSQSGSQLSKTRRAHGCSSQCAQGPGHTTSSAICHRLRCPNAVRTTTMLVPLKHPCSGGPRGCGFRGGAVAFPGRRAGSSERCESTCWASWADGLLRCMHEHHMCVLSSWKN